MKLERLDRGTVWELAIVFLAIATICGFCLCANADPPNPCPTCPPCTNCPPDLSTNIPPYSAAGLKLTIPVLTNGYIHTTVFEHNPGLAYDIYHKTNLNSTNWVIIAAGSVGETNYWITNSFVTDVFLEVGHGLDSDGDGMPDGWELLHGLNPGNSSDASQDADGDGLTNLQEYLGGSNPASLEGFAIFISSPSGYSNLP